MKKHNFKIKYMLLGLFGLSLGLSQLGQPTTVQAASDKLNIVTTTDFYGEVAKAVVGKYGKVTSIINSPNVDPHDFEPTTKTAKTVANSDLVLYNGVGYDSWVKKLGGKKYLAVGTIMKTKDGQNEHLWYKKDTMKKTANYLAKQYGKLDPKHQKQFTKNAKNYIKKLAKLDTQLAAIKKQAKGQKVAVSEPVFDYALKAMGYQIINQHFAKATEEGADPSYSDIKKLQTAIKKKEIAFFVANKQSDSKVIENIIELCHKNDIPVVKVTETLPKKQTYVKWMSSQYQQIIDLQK